MFDWLRPRRSYLFFYYSLVVWAVPLSLAPAKDLCPGYGISPGCVRAHPIPFFVGPLVATIICYPIAIGVTKLFPIERWSSNSRFLNRLFRPKNGDIMVLVTIALIFWLADLIASLRFTLGDMAPFWIWHLAIHTSTILEQPITALVLWYQEVTSSIVSFHPIWSWVQIPFLGLWHFLLAWMVVAITGRLTR